MTPEGLYSVFPSTEEYILQLLLLNNPWVLYEKRIEKMKYSAFGLTTLYLKMTALRSVAVHNNDFMCPGGGGGREEEEEEEEGGAKSADKRELCSKRWFL